MRRRINDVALAVGLGVALAGCGQPPGGGPVAKPDVPVVKLLIRESVVSVSMPNALSKSSGGTADGPGLKAQFEVERSPNGGGRTFWLRGSHSHFGPDEKVPEGQRGTFTVTADSESAIPASLEVDCPVPVTVVLDGNQVATPVELTPGRHQLTLTGRFKPER